MSNCMLAMEVLVNVLLELNMKIWFALLGFYHLHFGRFNCNAFHFVGFNSRVFQWCSRMFYWGLFWALVGFAWFYLIAFWCIYWGLSVCFGTFDSGLSFLLWWEYVGSIMGLLVHFTGV